MLLWCAAPASAAETLAEALAKAYVNNPTLNAARAELRATDELVPQALSDYRPTVTFNADVSRREEDTTGEDGGGDDEADDGGDVVVTPDFTGVGFGGGERRAPASASITLSQPLYRGGRTVAATRQAENLVLAQRARLVAIEQDVLLRSVTAYMDVVRDVAVVGLTASNVTVLERQLEAARARFEFGEITRTDVAQSEARLAGARAQNLEAVGNLRSSLAIYRELIGAVPPRLQEPLLPPDLPGNRSEAAASALANPNVVAAVFVERAARYGADAIFGELLPTVSLEGSVVTTGDLDVGGDGRTDEAAVTARVSVPLYEAGAVRSRLREAKQRVGQRRQEIFEQRRNAVQVATTAWHALQTARAQITSFAAEVEAAQIALEGVREEAQVGYRTILDVLDAEQELLNAQVNLVGARRDLIVAAYQLLASTGRLTAEELGLPTAVYNYERHYRRVRDEWLSTGPDLEGVGIGFDELPPPSPAEMEAVTQPQLPAGQARPRRSD